MKNKRYKVNETVFYMIWYKGEEISTSGLVIELDKTRIKVEDAYTYDRHWINKRDCLRFANPALEGNK